jgi:regulator of RNase E activity RraA
MCRTGIIDGLLVARLYDAQTIRRHWIPPRAFDIRLMTDDLLARCRAIASSTWSDALDQLQISGVLEGLALRNGTGSIAGTAVTVREVAGPLGAHPTAAFTPGTFLDAVGPGTVIMIDVGGALVSSCGGLVAQAAVQQGAVGLVIDGGCRDIAEIRATGLWVSSRHVTPISARGRVRIEAINVPVTIGGIRVHAGDYIVGDDTGVVCIPFGRVVEALGIAEAVSVKDARFASALRDGQTFTTAAAHLRQV